MPRGLDHMVHAVRDLDAAAELYRRLGFTVGARNRHPWGTHNHIIQLPGFFIELLTVAEPDKLGEEGFAKLFGRFNQDFLTRHEGWSGLLLESTNAKRDAAQFAQAGVAASEMLTFEREGQRPDGTPMRVGFSLAFAADPQPAEVMFATCLQLAPTNFWSPALMEHANDVRSVAGAVLVTENPADHHIFVSTFVGVRDMHTTSAGIVFKTPRGEVQIMDPTAFRDHFGIDAPDVTAAARLAALRLAVRDEARLIATLNAHGVDHTLNAGYVVVGPETAMGAVIAFERA